MIKEILLALIQGLTEFLPISSSGHLALFGNLFSSVNFSLFVFLHLASLFAVLIFFREKIKNLLFKDKKNIVLVIVGIIPAAVIGFLFKDFIENSFDSLLLIGFSFLITSVFLFLTKFQKKDKKLNLRDAFIIGLFQILALFPGISRSGITISSARILGIKKEETFDFSFLMFIPLVLGASFFEILENGISFSANFILPFFVCFFVSYFSLTLLNRTLKKGNFWIFGIYCLLVGIVSILLFFFS